MLILIFLCARYEWKVLNISFSPIFIMMLLLNNNFMFSNLFYKDSSKKSKKDKTPHSEKTNKNMLCTGCTKLISLESVL